MRKIKTAIDFDKNFLKKLVHTSNSGVTLLHSQHHLVIQPIQLNDLTNSVKDVLNEGIPKYHQNLDGILLGYEHIQLLSDKGIIHNDLIGIHFDLEADFYIFQPTVGTELKGTVNRKSKDHVGVLVYNSFNVSIPNPQTEDEWLGTPVNVGYEILFRITNFDFSSYLPYIRGELICILTKTDEDETYDQTKVENDKSKSKKRLFSETEVNEIVDDSMEIKRKKKKKEKYQNKELELDVEKSFLKPIDKKSSKKKSKKKKDEIESNMTFEDLDLKKLFSQDEDNIVEELFLEPRDKKSNKKKTKKRRNEPESNTPQKI